MFFDYNILFHRAFYKLETAHASISAVSFSLYWDQLCKFLFYAGTHKHTQVLQSIHVSLPFEANAFKFDGQTGWLEDIREMIPNDTLGTQRKQKSCFKFEHIRKLVLCLEWYIYSQCVIHWSLHLCLVSRISKRKRF